MLFEKSYKNLIFNLRVRVFDTVIVCGYGSRAVKSDHRHIVKVDLMGDVRGVVDGIVKVRLGHGYEVV